MTKDKASSKNTKTPRLSISLDEDYLQILDRFSQLNELPRATVVRMLLNQLRPTVEGLIEVHEMSVKDKSKALEKAQQIVGAAILDINQRKLFDD